MAAARSFTSPNSFLLFGVKTRLMCRHASASLSRLYGSIEKRSFLICSEVGVRSVQMVMVQPSMPPQSPVGAQSIGSFITALLRIQRRQLRINCSIGGLSLRTCSRH